MRSVAPSILPMQIDRIRARAISLPFAFDFSHSLRKGSSVKNVVVEVVAERGRIRGFGEGAPRPYVTGETVETACRAVAGLTGENAFPWQINRISDIWNYIDGVPENRAFNAAICALEIALLDAFARYENRYLIDYFPQTFYTDRIFYGAALPLTDPETALAGCHIVRDLGIRKLKLKLGPDLDQNRALLATVPAVFGRDYDLKIDVNCVWNRHIALDHIPLIKDFGIRVVEQPMMPMDPEIFQIVGPIRQAGALLMADESACTLSEVRRIHEEKSYGMINVRLSKCGGFRRSCQIIDYLRQNEIPFQIACHLGESGLLSAAGRILSLLCRDARYWDGSYDRFLLKENITTGPVTFGSGGETGPLKGPGLGVAVDVNALGRLSLDRDPITIERP
jgi:L-Ala-D/L-Glu epimerase